MGDGWIPVRSKKRPPVGLCVLVCGDGAGNVFTAIYYGRGVWLEWCTDDRDNGNPQSLPFKPSHWQELPKAVDHSESLEP